MGLFSMAGTSRRGPAQGAAGQVSADTWCDLYGDGQSMMASGFNGWAGVLHDGTLWHALGQPKAKAIRPLAIGTRVQALAADDDFLRATETGTASIKILHSAPGADATTADCR